MKSGALRKAAIVAALFSLATGTTLWAHNDPREMGAGPGMPTEQAQPSGGISEADMKALSNEGATPMMADGSTPAPEPTDDQATMDHGSMGGMTHDEMEDNSGKPFGERLFIWLGKLHTVVIHFPIAMIVAAFGLEVLGVVQRRHTWRSAARSMLVVGAIGAVLAASLGWFAGGFYLTDRNPILTIHRYLGMTIAIVSVVLAWAGLRRFHHERGRDMVFAVLLGLLTLGVLVQAFLGGTFMHGGMQHMNF